MADRSRNGARRARLRYQGKTWHLNRRSGTDLYGLAREINPQVRGWINYYGPFYRSELYAIAARIDEHLVRWAMQKFKDSEDVPTEHGAGWTQHSCDSPRSLPTGTSSPHRHAGLSGLPQLVGRSSPKLGR